MAKGYQMLLAERPRVRYSILYCFAWGFCPRQEKYKGQINTFRLYSHSAGRFSMTISIEPFDDNLIASFHGGNDAS